MNKLPNISGLSVSEYFNPKRVEKCDREKKCPVVTVSRSVGAGGSKIAELLADRLTVPCFGYSLIDGIIKESKQDKQLMSMVDEKAPGLLVDWIYAAFTKGKVSKPNFYQHLIKTTLAIAQTGGVIIGRGAHLILSNNPSVFRVRIEGSMEVCVNRIAKRENMNSKKAKEFILKTEKERVKYVKELFNYCPTNRSYYDLVINTDTVTPHDAVEVIIFAMKKMGYNVPGAEDIKKQLLSVAS
ncbi:MAG: cytidylate kinase-like family protein [Magnetococcales bacterium]|nr:cytidylate kinase-like family protein [Magnetococcales bacterium]